MDRSYSYICRLCGKLGKAYDLNITLNILTQNIAKIMEVKGSVIRLLDENKQTLEIAAAFGLSKTYLEKGTVMIKKHPIDQKVLRGQIISTKDITKKPHVYRKEAKKEGLKSVLSVPLEAENRIIGVVRVYTSVPHDFTTEEKEMLKALASLCGIIAQRARIWSEMRALIQISQSISSTLSLDEVLHLIAENAAKTLTMKAASIRLLDEERKKLQLRAAYGLSKSYLEKGSVDVEKSIIDKECLKCKVISIQNIQKNKRLQYPEELMREGVMALLTLPLTLRGSALGVLRVYASTPYTFTESDIDFLSALACQGAIAIENARLFEHIKSEYEDLTRDVWKWYDWGTRFPKI